MVLKFSGNEQKQDVFGEIEKYLSELGLTAVARDFSRPWGGFFVIDESQAREFAGVFFPDIEFASIQLNRKLSPKILVVQPGQRLSWQYHHRRAEIWRVRRDLTYALKLIAPIKFNHDVVVPKGRIPELFTLVARLRRERMSHAVRA